ncbi:hypothetical protein GCM10027020_35020 [Nocardioides salsibiostraticola]
MPVVLLGAALLVGCSGDADEDPTVPSGSASVVEAPSEGSTPSASEAPRGPSEVQFREVRASGLSSPGTTVLGEFREQFEALDCAASPSLAQIPAEEVQVSCDARELRYLLEPAVLATTVEEARVDVDESGSPLLTLTLDDEAAAELGQVTQGLADTGARLAVVVDGFVVRAMVVAAPIEGGVLQIPGAFTEAEADDLVRRLTVAP